MLTHRVDDGDKKARSPERARRKPLKPFARGKPDLPARTCGDFARVLFVFAHEAAGAQSASGFPCALCSLRDEDNCKARAKFVARTRDRVSMSKMPSLNRHHDRNVPLIRRGPSSAPAKRSSRID